MSLLRLVIGNGCDVLGAILFLVLNGSWVSPLPLVTVDSKGYTRPGNLRDFQSKSQNNEILKRQEQVTSDDIKYLFWIGNFIRAPDYILF